MATAAVAAIDRVIGRDPNYDGAMSDRHAGIMRQLPFGDGLTVERLLPLLRDAGFTDLRVSAHAPIARAQRKNADLRNKLRTFVYRRFVLRASKPQ